VLVYFSTLHRPAAFKTFASFIYPDACPVMQFIPRYPIPDKFFKEIDRRVSQRFILFLCINIWD